MHNSMYSICSKLYKLLLDVNRNNICKDCVHICDVSTLFFDLPSITCIHTCMYICRYREYSTILRTYIYMAGNIDRDIIRMYLTQF